MRSMLGTLILAALCVFPCEAGDWSVPDAGQDGRLVRLVVLSRHGVRSPTQSEHVLSEWAARPWPSWPVGRGELTPRGGVLIAAQWASLRPELAGQGVLPEEGCPGKGEVRVVADAEQRTRATAAALLNGLAPGCGLQAESRADATQELFHPVRAGRSKVDAEQSRVQIQTALERLSRSGELKAAMDVIQRVTGCCAPALCKQGSEMPCSLSDLPAAPVFFRNDVGLHGGLAMASSLAEIFLLEYAQWPDRAGGWGEVDTNVLKTILPVHNEVFDALNRSPAVAAARGGELLRAVRDALLEDSSRRLTVFVGHDTNIANLAGLLDLNWTFPDQGRNSIPPGGALVFFLWESKEGAREVRAGFLGPALETLHALPEKTVPLLFDAQMRCGASPCSAEAFSRRVDAATADL